MPKPPPDDPQMEQRVALLEEQVALLEEKVAVHEQAIADLNARVSVLEQASSTEPPIEIEPPPITSGMSVVIVVNDHAHAFLQETAKDLGVYADPAGRFEQHCYAATNSSLPGFLVMFRPDVEGDRREVVFELGDMFADSPTNMGAYDVEIYDGDDLIAEIAVPVHYWFARWRWQSAPRPVRLTPEALRDTGLVPYYPANGGELGRYTADMAPQVYEIMEFAGLATGMHWTGERADIGVVTEWQAQWLAKGNNTSTVLAQGEASGTIGMHVRDPDTGSPLDLLVRWPQATMYTNGGDPVIKTCAGLVTYDTGHPPAQAYLPWLMTGDPYFLEELQFQANMDMLSSPAKDPKSRYDDAGRYGAWPQRNKLYADVACPDDVPAWLLPKGNFGEHLEKTREIIIESMAKTDPVLAVFRCRGYGGSQGTLQHPAGNIASLWQDEMELAVYALCVQFGYPWIDQMRWKVQSQIRRVDGVSWTRSTPVPYNTSFHYTANLAVACDAVTTTLTMDKYGAPPWPPVPFVVKLSSEQMLVTAMHDRTWTVQRGYNDTTPAAQVVNRAVYGPAMVAWAEAWGRNEAVYREEFPRQQDDPTGMNQLYHASSGSVESPSKLRGALAIAVRAGATEAADALAWIDGEFQRWTTSQWHTSWRWCVAAPD